MKENEILINEDSTWFTRLRKEQYNTATILEHYRKHNSEEFTKEKKMLRPTYNIGSAPTVIGAFSHIIY